MSPDTKAIQNDDTANPGMLWVLDGENVVEAATPARRTRPAPIAMMTRAPA